MTEVAIVDYGAGNNQSVRNAFYMAGAEPVMASTPEQVLAADRLVIPGVGAANHAIAWIRERELDAALTEAVRERGRPTLGICLGMQIAARKLHEYGENDGLGWIDGEVVDLHDFEGLSGRIPHMGWNDIEPAEQCADLFGAIRGRRSFYFCHSYSLRGTPDATVAATVDFDVTLVAAVRDGTFFATQFHPEKSQINGQRLIETFLDWSP